MRPWHFISVSHNYVTCVPWGWRGAEQGLLSLLTVGQLRPGKSRFLRQMCLSFMPGSFMSSACSAPTARALSLKDLWDPRLLPVWSPGGNSKAVVRWTQPHSRQMLCVRAPR